MSGRRGGRRGGPPAVPPAPQPADRPAGDDPADEPAAQPNFDRLIQGLQAFTDEMGRISNLPSLNDRLLAQTRHEELVRLIGDAERRILDRLERRMTVK
jgi:hypothetical protein